HQGPFVLPSLPPGSYTLRAVGQGHEPSAARHVTVLPNRDALYTLSLTPVSEKSEAATAEATDSQAEWRWLGRPNRPSLFRTAGPELPALDDGKAPVVATPTLDTLGALDGSV